jgi:queuine tRNA-ribosyltransferase
MSSFSIQKKSGQSRFGTISTPHGTLKTPAYMPDATRGFIKLITPAELKEAGAEALVVNTYHLYLQPGLDVIKKAGGIHKFMGWNGPLISDSGGFQVFSLIHKDAKLGKIDDEKVTFKSPLDGSWHEFTPEKSIQIQFELGVDVMVCLDDCPPNDFEKELIERAVNRTIAWAKRCKAEFERQCKLRKLSKAKRPLLTAVIQGGADLALRKRCAEGLAAIGFDAYGFGARHVDKDGKIMTKVLKYTASLIPEGAIRFALGIGTLSDIKTCAALGWDIFDCVIPTREGRHGRLLSLKKSTAGFKESAWNVSNSKFKDDMSAINPDSCFPELKKGSKAFLHHLFRLNEPLGSKYAALNNLEAYYKWVKRIRSSK